ncbi:GDP-mannose transporter [Trypanosoma rangeli]|uniref:GDP-mannose transporter n=1 Tax=Trypanosoma rangeli TaxID=5698 RepID=A0A422NZI6_TRYRA|nr:GDP-mannose transporter [Trypanosoma rangeli]RNF10866.1 GDP-mannose transporter [Trypanosoma rangeli]|eukprot:RNF10866.1 GDP-mannose transporter [Trypanosoma rangeli]
MYSTAVYIHALLMFCVSSVGIMLSNTLAVTSLPLLCTLVLLQMIATLALLLPFPSHVKAMTPKNGPVWIPVALFFVLMLYTSMKSFVYASVPTVIIVCNSGFIVTTVVEYYVLGEVVNVEIIFGRGRRLLRSCGIRLGELHLFRYWTGVDARKHCWTRVLSDSCETHDEYCPGVRIRPQVHVGTV